MHLVQQLNNWSVWAIPNPRSCPCNGSGWLLSDFDTWHACGFHGPAPHPEDEEGHESFDHEAHRLRGLRKAFVAYREMSGMDSKSFKAAVIRKAGAGATPQQFVDVAQGFGEEGAYDAREAEARSQGFRCGLEMMLEEEAQLERMERGRY